VPEEVRPAPGKRQYVDLSKYMPDEEEEKEKAARTAPDAAGFAPGRYKCVSSWVNVRELPDTTSSIIGRLTQDATVSLLSVKVFGTAIRGEAERGGWVSIVGSAGKTLFERVGDVDAQELTGRYRVVVSAGALVYDSPEAKEAGGRVSAQEEFCVSEVVIAQSEDCRGTIVGKRADNGDGNGKWVALFSPELGLVCEKVVEGYNEKPRKPIKGQTGHQMMLVSDMVLLWDPAFRVIIDLYAEDEDLLKREFGDAFQKLTELGCPWSTFAPGPASGCPAGAAAKRGGCPVLAE